MSTTLAELATSWSQYAADLEASRRVLVIDDDPNVSELLVTALELEGFQCQRAGSGQEAVRVFLSGGFDAILVDKNLPDTSGIDLARHLQRFDSDCEVVVITGYANIESVLDAMKLRAVDYLTKPLDDIALLPATFERALRRRRRRLQARRMLTDLRREVSLRVSDEDRGGLEELRGGIEDFKRANQDLRRVIFARDQRDELHAGIKSLKSAGFELLVADSADAALRHVARTVIQVALVTEPFGDMDGLAFFDELNQLHGQPEVIFVAQEGDLDATIEALSRGASAYFTSPFADLDAVTAAVRRACDDHHERMYHYKLVTALHGVLSDLADREKHTGASPDAQKILGEFDLDTARLAIRTFESPG